MNLIKCLKEKNLSWAVDQEKLLEGDHFFSDVDKKIVWDFNVELLTRVLTQSIPFDHGDDVAIIESFKKFINFRKELLSAHTLYHPIVGYLLITLFDQIVSPFLLKWGTLGIPDGELENDDKLRMRQDLKIVQRNLLNFSQILNEICETGDLAYL